MSSSNKSEQPCRLVVLISGNGTNLQAIIDSCEKKKSPAKIVGVICNEPTANGLIRAKNANIPTSVIDHRNFQKRSSFDDQLKDLIDGYDPNLVALAGFMRILGPRLTKYFLGKIINIHPSLLPCYPGLNTHARALADGVSEHGATVHFVTPELDSGPIILQCRIQVHATDTPDTLAQRVHQCEYKIYPRAITWFATGRLQLKQDQAHLDDEPISL